MEDLHRPLVNLLAGTRDYLSHAAALHRLGLLPGLTGPITVVTSGRRRSRQVGGRAIRFVTHPATRPRETRKIQNGPGFLVISTVEQALIDLVTDHHLGFGLQFLASCFARLPYKVSRLVEMAAKTSDAAHKRVLFWILWTGRGSWEDLPPALSRATVNLDPASAGLPSAWVTPLHLRYPLDVAGLALPQGPASLPAEITDWMKLLRYPPFRTFCREADWFPIRGDPRPAGQSQLRAFLESQITRLLVENPATLLVKAFPGPAGQSPSDPLPPVLIRRLHDLPAFPANWRDAIAGWARSALGSTDPEVLEAAIFWAHRSGWRKEAVARMAEAGALLFKAGRGRVAELLLGPSAPGDPPQGSPETRHPPSRRRSPGGSALPLGARILLARVLVRGERLTEALGVVEAGRSGRGSPPPGSLGQAELAYAAGTILRQAGRPAEAIRELELARSNFHAHGDRQRESVVEMAIGNLHLAQNRLTEARRSYLTVLRQRKDPHDAPFQATLLTNLGMVENKAGRFQRASGFLGRAVRIFRELGNAHGEAVALVTRGKVLLSMGEIPRAFRNFLASWRIHAGLGEAGRRAETMALLAWASDLMGHGAVAQNWWDRVEAVAPHDLPRPSRFLVTIVRAMRRMLAGYWKAAERILLEAVELGRAMGAPSDETGYLHWLLGVTRTRIRGPQAKDSLEAARRDLAGSPRHVLTRMVGVFAALHHSGDFGSPDPGDLLPGLVQDRYFDPFWFLSAQALMAGEVRSGEAFLLAQARCTPPVLRRILGRRFPFLRPLFKKTTRAEAGASDRTLIRNGRPEPMDAPAYRVWRRRMDGGGLRFDGPSGRIANGAARGFFRPGSHTHAVLSHLMLAEAQVVALDAIYRSVWGGEFDAECDAGALSTALRRLGRVLRRLSPDVRLLWGKTAARPAHLVLLLEGDWEAVL